MYLSLQLIGNHFDINNNEIIIHYYRINDTNFKKDFMTTYKKNNGKWDDIDHINQILYNIYDIYRHSKYATCKNMAKCMVHTFYTANETIKKTSFYKEHKKLIDSILKE